jgi:hypothetical protein
MTPRTPPYLTPPVYLAPVAYLELTDRLSRVSDTAAADYEAQLAFETAGHRDGTATAPRRRPPGGQHHPGRPPPPTR